jgi:ACS family tartrate transporter-like MFS transporter
MTLFCLADWPKQAKWLTRAEAEWITDQLAGEAEAKRLAGKVSLRDAVGEVNVIFLALGLFFVVLGGYGFVLWLPGTIKELSGLSVAQSTLLSGLPFLCAFGAIAVCGWSSDRMNERKLHAAIPMACGGLFLWLSTIKGQPMVLVMMHLCLTGACTYAWAPAFWSLPTLLLGQSAAAVAVGFINCIGNLGGFAGPYLVGHFLSSGYSKPVVMRALALSFFLAACFLSLTRLKRIEIKYP